MTHNPFRNFNSSPEVIRATDRRLAAPVRAEKAVGAIVRDRDGLHRRRPERAREIADRRE